MENDNSTFDLYDPVSKSSITFKSESDALFAAFCLGNRLGTKLLFPPGVIGAFIGFLKNSRFRADQLTFTNTKDITNKISQSRRAVRDRRNKRIMHMTVKRTRERREAALVQREVALKLPTPAYSKVLAGNIPKLVLEHVAENLVSAPLVHATSYRYLAQTRLQELNNVCLVHHSWAATIQHLLGRYIVVEDDMEMEGLEIYDFLASPLLGPSTRLLSYQYKPLVIPDISPSESQCDISLSSRGDYYQNDFDQVFDGASFGDASEQGDEDDGLIDDEYEDGIEQDKDADSIEDGHINNAEDSSFDHQDAENNDHEDDAEQGDNKDFLEDYIIQGEQNDYHEEPIQMPEETRNLLHVLSVCTGLRVLRIHGSLYEIGSYTFHRIAQLKNLEVLSLDSNSRAYSLLHICTTLPNMRRLKSLTLRHFECLTYIIPSSFEEFSPPSSLTDVDVSFLGLGEGDRDLLSWLFRPRKAYSVISTVIDPYQLFEFDAMPCPLYRALAPALSGLEAITLDISDWNSTNYSKRLKYKSTIDALSICTRLRAIRIINCYDWKGLDWTPPNIEKLRIDVDRTLHDEYDHIEAFVRKLPNLCSLYIVQDPEMADSDDQIIQEKGITGLHSLKLYCAQNSIEFSRLDIMEMFWW